MNKLDNNIPLYANMNDSQISFLVPKFLPLLGEVNSDMTARVAASIYKEKPIIFEALLVSEGGNFGDGLAIYDMIKSVPQSIVTASGICASAALFILQAATKRLATKATLFLSHEPTVESSNQDEVEQLKQSFNEAHIRLLSKRIGKDNYKTAMKLKVFDAVIALKLNFIDEII